MKQNRHIGTASPLPWTTDTLEAYLDHKFSYRVAADVPTARIAILNGDDLAAYLKLEQNGRIVTLYLNDDTSPDVAAHLAVDLRSVLPPVLRLAVAKGDLFITRRLQ